MTFEQLCESMGWMKDGFGRWLYKGVLMAIGKKLTPAGAIAVQTEYQMTTQVLSNKHCLAMASGAKESAPDIPTAIRDCAMEIKNAPSGEDT